jgi:hypothetical protein
MLMKLTATHETLGDVRCLQLGAFRRRMRGETRARSARARRSAVKTARSWRVILTLRTSRGRGV